MNNSKNVLYKILDVFLPLLIYYLASSIVSLGASTLIRNIAEGKGEAGVFWLYNNAQAVNAICNGIGMIIGVLFLRVHFVSEVCAKGEVVRSYKWRIFRSASHEGAKKIKALGWDLYIPVILSVAFAFFANSVFSILNNLINDSVFEEVASGQFSVSVLWGVVLFGIVSPVSEEIVFRGVLLNKISRYTGRVSGVILSSFLFGLMHFNLVQGVYGFLMGILFAEAYIVFDCFAVPVIMHSLANLCIYLGTVLGIYSEKSLYVIIPVSAVFTILGIVLLIKKRNGKSEKV